MHGRGIRGICANRPAIHFFFQAEDGIRGYKVTGVQTCALPICFGFSAGLFDYVLNFSRATRPLWLLPVGALYFALYYGLFRLVIVRLDLKTPGRDALERSEERRVGEEGRSPWSAYH